MNDAHADDAFTIITDPCFLTCPPTSHTLNFTCPNKTVSTLKQTVWIVVIGSLRRRR